MPDAVFDYVMGDVLTTVVVELMAVPPQVRGAARAVCRMSVPHLCLLGEARTSQQAASKRVIL